jgi:predicted signal transduction protein with EAL and GGDEF domain
MTVSFRRLSVLVQTTAAVLVGVGVLVGTGLAEAVLPGLPWSDPRLSGTGHVPLLSSLAAGAAIVALGQLARVSVRVGASSVTLAWGEAAIVVVCALVPLPWVPLTMLAGLLVSHGLMDLRTRPYLRARMYTIAALTCAGSVAAIVATAITPVHLPDMGRPWVVLALCAGAVGYAVTGGGLVSAKIAVRDGVSVVRVFHETMVSKLGMIVGNVAVGLFAVTLYSHDKGWLLLLPPALWLLHQIYAYRLRSDTERRTWQTFSEATRELNRLDEHDAAVAGVLGALRLFSAAAAELVLTNPDGTTRGFVAETGGAVAERTPAALLDGAHVTSRALMVGGVRVGELRLRLRSPALLSNRDHLMFAAYGDALAAALHDAATHHALTSMAERTSFDAVHDPVTGVTNRAGFLLRGDAMVRLLEPESMIGLLMLDIDRFRQVNDTLGHAAGDQLLQITARRLAAALRPGEVLARLGGDEFGIFVTTLPKTGGVALPMLPALPVPPASDGGPSNGLDAAEHPVQVNYLLARARGLADELAVPTEVAGVQLSVEASVGVVAAAAGTVDMTELMRRADIAMYQAKRGGSSVAWYDISRDDASTDRLALLAEMREALASGDQLTLLLQPTIELATGRAVGAEALVRWRHPRRGMLKPVEFVKIVEHSELVGGFTRYVLDRALRVASGWLAKGVDLPIAVNLSPRSLLDPYLPEYIGELLAGHRFPANRLILEITETVVMSELTVIDQVLGDLRRMGIQLAVDDFGTGYSSLTFLTRVQVDEVKIDRTFVRRMFDSDEAKAIVSTTVELGRSLGLRVVAEGVETAEQRKALGALGCVAAQGFHFYRPMSPQRVVDVLASLFRPDETGLAEGTG